MWSDLGIWPDWMDDLYRDDAFVVTFCIICDRFNWGSDGVCDRCLTKLES